MEKRLELLVPALVRDERIIFAYLFGGMTSGVMKPLSDLDLAVYLVPHASRVEAKLELSGIVADAVGTDEFDLVILNDAPLSLVGRIVGKRRVMVDKQPFVRHAFESRIIREFFDFSRKEHDILFRRFA
jgi:predicted nucleotidyltransferase